MSRTSASNAQPNFVINRPRSRAAEVSRALSEARIVLKSLPARPLLNFRRRIWPGLLMACADFAGLLLAASVAMLLLRAGVSHLPYSGAIIASLAGAFLSVYLLCGLYPGMATHPVDELRSLTLATTFSTLAISAVAIFDRSPAGLAQFSLRLWPAAVVAVPSARTLMRHVCQRHGWWGVPTVIVGAGATGRKIARTLLDNPCLGLKPIGVLDDSPARYQRGNWSRSLPYLGPIRHAPAVAALHSVEHAIVAMPGASPSTIARLISRYALSFPHLLVVPNLHGIASLWVRPRCVGSVFGIEITQLLAQRFPQLIKRSFDVALASIALVLLGPVFAALFAIIRLESPGPALYFQHRLGKAGKPFKVWKFRSMFADSERVLERALANDPALAAEWEANRKLRRDPRVTGFGQVIRKLSLDELPQIWNVLIGDMSLVGPRPIVSAEIERYRLRYASYALVRPGITGLWQVSGRNNTSYDRRTELDEFYVRNWSVWLDIYLLVRTVRTVLTCEGAY